MVRFGLSLPLTADLDRLVNLSIRAEEVGFDYVWMPDHILSLDLKEPLNVWSVLSVLATRTKHARIGPLVANIYRQHPSTLYQQVSTLKRISGNKAVLGIGAGTVFDTAPFGIERNKPVRCMREIIQSVKSRIGVAVYVGASGPKIKKLAGMMADGWVSRHACTVSEYAEELDGVIRWVGNRPFDYIADIPVSFVDTPRIWRSLAYRYLLATHFKDMVFTQEMLKEIEKSSSLVPRETLQNISGVGDKDRIIDVLERYIKLGVNLFSIRLYCDSFERFGEVIQYFKRIS